MAKFRCIIADDEPLVREGIASFINKNFPDISIEGCFEDGAQALDFIKSGKKIDFAVLDIKMITVSGLEVSQFIFDNRLPIKVIVITGYREFDYAITAMNQHVEGILLKPISFEKLQSALENIVNSLNDDRNIIIKQKKFLVILIIQIFINGYFHFFAAVYSKNFSILNLNNNLAHEIILLLKSSFYFPRQMYQLCPNHQKKR